MTAKLEDWQRKYYTPGGGDPFLFYVAFGNIDTNEVLSASRYRCAGVPVGIELTSYRRAEHREVFDTFVEGYLWAGLKANNPALAMEVERSQACVVLRGSIPDAETLNYLRDTVGLLTFFLDHGARAIYDPQMFQWWEPSLWRQRIFQPAAAVPRHHVVILVSAETDRDTSWVHTRGMRKFGRPDISIRRVGRTYHEAIVDLCKRFIEYQAFGGLIEEGQTIQMESLPPGGIVRHAGDIDDPEFNNVHVEISWDHSACQH
jgi:hypothetical protein